MKNKTLYIGVPVGTIVLFIGLLNIPQELMNWAVANLTPSRETAAIGFLIGGVNIAALIMYRKRHKS